MSKNMPSATLARPNWYLLPICVYLGSAYSVNPSNKACGSCLGFTEWILKNMKCGRLNVLAVSAFTSLP